jgi:hypothetical protein
MKQSIVLGSAFALCLAIAGGTSAHPIVYKLYATTDGTIGGKAFADAKVVLSFFSDTDDAVTATENGVTVYRNDHGRADIAITQAGSTTVARIEPHQLFVRYDPTNAVLGFGSVLASAVNNTYPLVLVCTTSSTPCYFGSSNGNFGTIISAIADLNANPALVTRYSQRIQSLRLDLKGPTLLTGYSSACATAYSNTSGECPTTAPVAIKTDQGDLYFQDSHSPSKGLFTATWPPETDE